MLTHAGNELGTGVAILPSHPEMLVSAIALLLVNTTHWRRASNAARAFAYAHFHPRDLEIEVRALLAAAGLHHVNV
jgi:hypothetical protein